MIDNHGRRFRQPPRIRLGRDAHHNVVELRFVGLENPHILLCGGSQSGKTSLLIWLVSIAAAHGVICICLDPKMRLAKAFTDPSTGRTLPHVPVYDAAVNEDSTDMTAAAEWHGVLELLDRVRQKRYRHDRAGRANLADLDRFPPILIICDELGRLLEFADKEWRYRKPPNYKGETPIREMLHGQAAMGAEARQFLVVANQTAASNEMPVDGTVTRQLFGQRVVLGWMEEPVQRQMVFGTKEALRPARQQPGDGVVMYGAGAPAQFKGGHWTPEDLERGKAFEIASRGEEVLRRSGHIDVNDRLILEGLPIPRPGQMASHVTGPSIDLLQDDAAAETASRDADGPDGPVSTPATPPVTFSVPASSVTALPEPRLVRGNKAGAQAAGMSVANFRAHRRKYPIPGETKQGKTPVWPEPQLCEWARLRRLMADKHREKAA